MKINQKYLIALLLTVVASTVFADGASNAKAAELALHRIERLIILKKIPATFETNLSEVSATKLTQAQPTDPAFEAEISQIISQDGTQQKVQVFMDTNGRALSFTQTTGGEALNPPKWPVTDSVTFLEYSLHCLEGELIGTNDLCQKTTTLREFETNFLNATLSQDSAGLAVITITETSSTSKAIVRFNTDGSLAANVPIEITH